MSKPKIKIENFAEDIDKFFNLLNKIDLSNPKKMKKIEKEAKELKDILENHSKNMDTKE